MGNSIGSYQNTLKKGEGYRIIGVRKNSPLEGLIDPFFDFIVGVSLVNPPQRSPKDILNKLSPPERPPQFKSIQQQISSYQNQQVLFKIISTKFRNVRSVQAIPNNSWNGTQDVIGLQLRKQRYDQAFDTYSQISTVQNNSPTKQAGIIQGQYLIGILEFKYTSLNQLMQLLYDKFFDKEVPNKTVHLAIYSMIQDDLRIVSVTLSRGWGGKGLLGCDFFQGYLYKFPSKLNEHRDQILEKQRMKKRQQKIREQLHECNGASKTMVQALKINRNKAKNTEHIKHIHSILSIKPPPMMVEQPIQILQINNGRQVNRDYNERISVLENKVIYLQQTLYAVKKYLDNIQIQDQQIQRQRQNR